MPDKKCPECGSNEVMFIGRKEGKNLWECKNSGNAWEE